MPNLGGRDRGAHQEKGPATKGTSEVNQRARWGRLGVKEGKRTQSGQPRAAATHGGRRGGSGRGGNRDSQRQWGGRQVVSAAPVCVGRQGAQPRGAAKKTRGSNKVLAPEGGASRGSVDEAGRATDRVTEVWARWARRGRGCSACAGAAGLKVADTHSPGRGGPAVAHAAGVGGRARAWLARRGAPLARLGGRSRGSPQPEGVPRGAATLGMYGLAARSL